MRVALPHNLSRDELRRRFHRQDNDLVGRFPPGMGEITQTWRDEDHLDLGIHAMGQSITGQVTLEDKVVVVEVELPMMLSFLGGVIESGIREKGTKLLAP